MNTAWGVSITGVPIFNGISGEGVDPFYPAQYGKVLVRSWAVEEVDNCLSHPGGADDLHYHVPSTCAGDKKWEDDTVGINDQDVMKVIRDSWKNKGYRSVFGLSKDGRPIYGPFYDDGKEYDDCDVDVCNGLMIDGEYSYVSTFFHPYVMGCYGPGNNPPFA